MCSQHTSIMYLHGAIVSIRASLTGWLTLHHQTKLVIPGTGTRLAAILTALFTLPLLGYVILPFFPN